MDPQCPTDAPVPPAERYLAALQRAFGARLRVVGKLRPASRAEERRRLAALELTTSTLGQGEITGDGRVVRAWPRARPRAPGRRRRTAAAARAAPREGPEPPPAAPADDSTARAVEALTKEVRALRAELRGERSASAERPAPPATRKPRRRPVAPRTLEPTEIDRARAKAALKKSGYVPVR